MTWWERERSTILMGLFNLLVIGGLVFLLRRPPPSSVQLVLPPPTETPPPTATPAPSATPLPTPTPGPLRVYICGAVRAPDVYALPAGSILRDALTAAGGPAEEADLTRVNLARELHDQDYIYIPTHEETVIPTMAAPAGPSPTTPPAVNTSRVLPPAYPLNLNNATLEELETLPGIGPVLAQRIIDHRPYANVEELLNVPGIGPATYEKIKDKLVVQ
ncbi:MAG: helix-hairpin-helix domain-containing protein [Anaerolineae bacterium]